MIFFLIRGPHALTGVQMDGVTAARIITRCMRLAPYSLDNGIIRVQRYESLLVAGFAYGSLNLFTVDDADTAFVERETDCCNASRPRDNEYPCRRASNLKS
jgi:hypothetical protein